MYLMEQYYYRNNFMKSDICPCCQEPPCMRSPQLPNYPQHSNIPALPKVHIPDFWTFGPLKIEWSFSGESINVIFKAFEEAVQNVILTLADPTLSFTTTLGNTTINLKVNADFIKNEISINGAACFDTVCTTFNNTVIARW